MISCLYDVALDLADCLDRYLSDDLTLIPDARAELYDLLPELREAIADEAVYGEVAGVA